MNVVFERRKYLLSPLVLQVLRAAGKPLTANQITSHLQSTKKLPVSVKRVTNCLTFALEGRGVCRSRPFTKPLHWQLSEDQEAVSKNGEPL